MKNPFPHSDTNLRYYSYQYYLKQKYGTRVFKVPLDAGFTCPNRDGTLASSGCSFCTALGSGEFAGKRYEDLLTQYQKGKTALSSKWPEGKTIAYFQAFTNTYGTVEKLKEITTPFLDLSEVVEISYATRPDCLPDEIIKYLQELTTQKEIWVELGLQTIHDETAKDFHRGYDTAVFLDTIKRFENTNVKICVHIINGLSQETPEMMLETASLLSTLPIHAIKIHMLHLMKNSAWGKAYQENPWPLLSEDEYAGIVVNQLEILPPNLIIERLTGDGEASQLLAPIWTIKKIKTINEIQKEFVRRDTYQGVYYGRKY